MEKTLARIVRGSDDIAERFQRFYKNNFVEDAITFRYLEEKQIITEFIEFEKFDEQDILDIIEKFHTILHRKIFLGSIENLGVRISSTITLRNFSNISF